MNDWVTLGVEKSASNQVEWKVERYSNFEDIRIDREVIKR